MQSEIKNIIVVGGGTAGWLSACYLNRALFGRIKITVVEAPTIGRIGVGEATVPTLRETFKFVGLEERDWMRECNATFKLGIRFVDWLHGPNSKVDDHYYHLFFPHPGPWHNPFGSDWFVKIGQGYSLLQYWKQQYARGNKMQFGELAGPLQSLCEDQKSPKPLFDSNGQDYDLPYAYHLDAMLAADMLKKKWVYPDLAKPF